MNNRYAYCVKKQESAIRDAVLNHYVNPGLVREVLQFAEDQGEFFTHYDCINGHFILSDGEAYTKEAVLRHSSSVCLNPCSLKYALILMTILDQVRFNFLQKNCILLRVG